MDLFSICPQNCVQALMFSFVFTKIYKDTGMLLKQTELPDSTSDCSHNPLFWLYALEINTVKILS